MYSCPGAVNRWPGTPSSSEKIPARSTVVLCAQIAGLGNRAHGIRHRVRPARVVAVTHAPIAQLLRGKGRFERIRLGREIGDLGGARGFALANRSGPSPPARTRRPASMSHSLPRGVGRHASRRRPGAGELRRGRERTAHGMGLPPCEAGKRPDSRAWHSLEFVLKLDTDVLPLLVLAIEVRLVATGIVGVHQFSADEL